MDVKTWLFCFFAGLMLFAAIKVITTRNPVHAALYLVLAFFQASGSWLLLQAEFLAIALVLVYVGAVMVLFLFVVMMLDVNIDSIRAGFWKNFPLIGLFGVTIALEMSWALGNYRGTEVPKMVNAVVPHAGKLVQSSNTKDLGILLYTQYLYPLEIAAVILLVAIIAAIALTLRQRKDSKYVNPADQVRVHARDRMQVIKMKATQEALPVVAPEVVSDATGTQVAPVIAVAAVVEKKV
jgi:NADH-quinone oxidoreductase subunit J